MKATPINRFDLQLNTINVLLYYTFNSGGGGGLPYKTDGDARRKF